MVDNFYVINYFFKTKDSKNLGFTNLKLHYNKVMTLCSFIPLKVHCWGGLGSQLYALATAMQLQERFVKRRIILVLHTGGVTKRASEVKTINNGLFVIKQVDDYAINSDPESMNQISNQDLRAKANLIVKKVLIKTGFLGLANTTEEFKKMRPWVISVKGHYLYRQPPLSFYDYLLSQISGYRQLKKKNNHVLAIHYRLGDLLNLSQKSIYPVEKIVSEVVRVTKVWPDASVVVYSDSPQEVRQILVSAGLRQQFEVSGGSTLQVVGECLDADFFIGTNSKISLWIVNIRRYLGLVESNYLQGWPEQYLIHRSTQLGISK